MAAPGFQDIIYQGTRIEFPDDMSDKEIMQVLESLDLSDRAALSPEVEEDKTPRQIIIEAADELGVPRNIMLGIVDVETGGKFNPDAKNEIGSASGLFQFIDETWESVVGMHGAKHSVMVGDRFDARSNAIMGAEFTKSNIEKLTKLFGRPPTPEEAYFTHFSGFPAAKKIFKQLKKNPNLTPAQAWGKQAVKNNPDLMNDRTAQEVMDLLTRKMTRAVGNIDPAMLAPIPVIAEAPVEEKQDIPETEPTFNLTPMDPGFFERGDGTFFEITPDGEKLEHGN